MTNRKKPLIQKMNYSLQRRLLGKSNCSYPIFLLLLLVFSSLNLSIASPLLSTGQASMPMIDQSLHASTYVEPTLLALYPFDGCFRTVGFAMRDNYIYTIIDYNPTVIDVSNASNPIFVAEYVFEDNRLNTLALQDNFLYLGSNYGLEILNISNLACITKAGEYNTTTGGRVKSIVLQDNYAYLAGEDNGLIIVNISDPANPLEVGCYSTNLSANDIAVKGSLIYVANGNETGNALVILDVSDPQNPVEISYYEDEVYGEMPGIGISLNGSYAYLGTFGHGLFILDISDIYHPIKVSHFYGGTESIGGSLNRERVKDIFLHNQYAFEAAGRNGLYILDVSNPSNPTLVGKFQCYYLIGLHLHKTYLFLQELLDGILILNLTYYSANPKTYTGLIITLISIPIVCVVVVLPLFLKYKRKKKMEKTVNLFRTENTKE